MSNQLMHKLHIFLRQLIHADAGCASHPQQKIRGNVERTSQFPQQLGEEFKYSLFPGVNAGARDVQLPG